MASAVRLPIRTIAFTAALTVVLGASRINIRNLLVRTFTGPGSYSRIVAAILAVANLKNVPFAWHYRVWSAILRHCLFSLPNIPPSRGPSSLFLPVITTSHSPLWECDYNFHKSNSTYFSDLDVTRSHIVSCLLQPAIHKLMRNAQYRLVLDKEGEPVKGKMSFMLGSVMCSFKREIGMYEGYEMWSRLLCWDRKWLYIVTHFVQKGAVKPSEYVLTDGTWFGGKRYRNVKGGKGQEATVVDVDEKYIFASSISKYVIKLGRLTTHPEVSLEASGLLPPRPGGWASMSGSGDSTPDTVMVEASVSANGTPRIDEEWDWKKTVAENERGLKYVEHVAALDSLKTEFTGSGAPALGRYKDFLW